MRKICFIIIFISVFAFCIDIKAIRYPEYKIGDEITYNGMKFYVIYNSENDSEIVTTIKAEPLTVDEINKYKDDNHVNVNANASLGEANNDNGYGSVVFYSDYKKCGYWAYYRDSGVTISDHISNYVGCSLKYENSDIKYIVDSWVNDSIKNSDLYKDEYGYKYRLLSNNDLLSLGYKLNSSNKFEKTTSVPSFIYNDKYGYWIAHSYEYEDRISFNTSGSPLIKTIDRSYIDSDGNVLEFDENFSTSNVTIFDMHTIRPIVNFRKRAITSSGNNVKSIQSSSFSMGDIVDYNGIKYYVIKNFKQNDNALFLVKTTPLSIDEVNKYGKGYINRYTTESQGVAYDNRGYGGVAYYSRRDCREGYISGCNTSYKNSDIKHIIDAWAKDAIGESNDYSVRVLDSSDLIEFGYDNFGTSVDYYQGNFYTPELLLDLKDCWTSKTYNDYYKSLYTISDNASLVSTDIYDYKKLIYPVVVIKKNEFLEVKSPNTGLNKSYVFTIIGLVLLIASGLIYTLKNKYNKIL